jgi:hypothetical protein
MKISCLEREAIHGNELHKLPLGVEGKYDTQRDKVRQMRRNDGREQYLFGKLGQTKAREHRHVHDRSI